MKFIYPIKALVLLPFRLFVALFWFFWTLIFDGLYPGCAPIFWNADHSILFLRRKWFRYNVVLHDLVTHKENIIYQREIPIEQYLLKANGELICRSYQKGENKYSVISLGNRLLDHPAINEYSIPSFSRFPNALLPVSTGVICEKQTCSNTGCTYQIIKATYRDDKIVEDNLAAINRNISVSCDETFVSFSTKKGIYINNLLTGKQYFYPEETSNVYNWDIHSNLLAYNQDKNYFLLLNPVTLEKKTIQIPVIFSAKKVIFASLSPSGNYIVYYACAKRYLKKEDRLLILQSSCNHEYKILSPKAKVFDIRWSDSEKYISIAGVNKRDLFDISYGYKMRNANNHDKEIIDIEGNTILKL